jgi:hypothetical protein
MRAPDGKRRSDRVNSRHGPLAAYRCFLPDLAGFAGLPCARPDHQRDVHHPAPTRSDAAAYRSESARAMTRPHLAVSVPRGLAERPGFEPGVEFPPHTLSRRAPSTTRTPLRMAIRGRVLSLDVRPGTRAGIEHGGEGGIRTHVGVAPQPAFEAGPLRPLRYLSRIVSPAGVPRVGSPDVSGWAAVGSGLPRVPATPSESPRSA